MTNADNRSLLSFCLKLNHIKDTTKPINEISRNNCQGTIRGNPTIVPDVLFGSCLKFDGNGDYIEFSSPDVPIRNEPYTIEAWIKPESGALGIVGWGNFGTFNQVNALRLFDTPSRGKGIVNLPNRSVRVRTPVFDTPSRGKGIVNYWWGNETVDLYATCNLIDGNWHHVAATFDSQTRRIFIDGEEEATDTPTGHNVPNSSKFCIGSTNDVEYFKGCIAIVRIRRNALTAEEIKQLIELDKLKPVEPTNPALQLHLRMNKVLEGITPNTHEVQDFSGYERHGIFATSANGPANKLPVLSADDRLGSCLTFENDTAAINVNNPPSFAADESFTLGLWVKPKLTASNTNAVILNWQNVLKITQKGNAWELSLQGQTTISENLGTISDGNWHHLAVTIDRESDEISIYLDGSWVASKSGAIQLGALGTQNSTLQIAPAP